MRRYILPIVLCAMTLPGQTPQLTSADLETFLDGLVPNQLERSDIAGAVISVVKDGKVLFQKGYGYADVAAKKPPSADSTLFRPGSISKLFIWTSVMQMVEQGKLDLDKDVNQYLDFKVPAGITMRHIMTHSTGFEETVRELFVPSAKELGTLRDYLVNGVPQQIFPAGKVPAYSNYATALAGYIVQRLSGEQIEQYVDRHIFKPLGMERTTFVQPLPDAMQPLMSVGYQVASGKAKGFEFVKAYPAGSVSTTAADMTRFMIAHLNDGKFGDVEILKPETARLMHTRQASPYPAANAMALGFYETSRNGHRMIAHGGDTGWFHSNLELILDSNVGFFISQNSAGNGGGDVRGLVGRKFMDRYFPGKPLKQEEQKTAKEHAAEVAGYYLSSRRVEHGFPAVMGVAGQLHIISKGDGSLSALRDTNGQPKKFIEVEPFVFRDVNSEDRLIFRRDDAGNLEMNIGYPFMVFQKASMSNNQVVNLTLLGVGVGVIALTFLMWPAGAMIRWHYGRRLEIEGGHRRLRFWLMILCAVEIAFWVGWGTLSTVLQDIGSLGPALDGKQHFVQSLGWIAALGVPLSLYAALKRWTASGVWWFARLHSTALAFAFVFCTWFAWKWQLLTWSTHY